MTLHVAVDFGTSSTCVAISVDGRDPQVVVVDGQPLVPSAVFAAADGTIFVGQEAERQAAIDPSRYEPNPKRRIDEGELLLGNTVIPVLDVVRAVLGRAVAEARRLAGNAPVDVLVLTHPADWGAIRTRVLRQAGAGLAGEVTLVPEPVAAAVFHAASHALPDGGALAVLDLGGGTVDVSVVRRQSSGQSGTEHSVGGFTVLATHGDPNFGGADIDQLLLEHVGSLVADANRDDWRSLTQGRELSDRRRRRVIHQDVRGAKETLSRHTYTDVPMPPPFPDAHVTRDDLEQLIVGPLRRAVALTTETIAQAGLRPEDLSGVFLVGGSSRIPLVGRLVYQRLGVIPTTLDQPETVVARGALRAVSHDPLRTGGLPEQRTTAMPVPGAPLRAPGVPGAQDLATAQTVVMRPAVSPQSAPHQSTPRQSTPRPVSTAMAAMSTATRLAAVRARGKRRLAFAGALVVLIAAGITGFLLYGDSGGATQPGAATPAPSATVRQGVIAQYDYTFAMPAGWAQTAGNATDLEVEIAPTNTASVGDAIYVREFKLSYDSTTDRQRAVDELRPLVLQAGYLNFEPKSTYATRTVASYQQPGNDATVDWYVLFQGRVQISVGCQFTPTDQAMVQSVCQRVVGGMTVTSGG